MPDVKCEIAWDGGFRVPMASWTWTDVSAYVELADGISVTWGRGDERSTCDANTLALTLDNSDGRFTAGKTGALVLNGVSPGRASTPDATALDITGDIDIRVHAALDDWTPAAEPTLISKWTNTGNQRSYMLNVMPTGVLRVYWSTNGTAFIWASSTVAPAVANGGPLWVRATLDVDNGAAGHTAVFYTSTDGATWTQLGATVTTAGVTSIFSGTAELAVSGHTSGTVRQLSGRVFSAEVRNGIDGAIVASPDFRAQTTGATSFVDSTGKTWTIVSPATLDGAPYYDNVKLYKPIRVKATPVDGAESVRFTGYINSLPVEWEDTDAYAKATITATSRLARLGLNAQWRSLVEETYLADLPAIYYPLGEPEGSTLAADVSGLGASPLTMVGGGDPVVFGQATGPPTDDLTAATFAGGQYLTGAHPPTLTAATVEAFFSSETLPTLSGSPTVASVGNMALIHVAAGGVAVTVGGGAALVTSSNITDGATHHVAATWDGTTVRLYVAGALVGSAASTGVVTGPVIVGGPGTVATLTGVVAHAAAYTTALSAARLLEHATAGSTAFAGETTKARFERYALLADIPAAEVNSEAGSTTVAHIDTTGKNVVDLLRTIETTEAGVMFDGRDGVLTLHNRAHRYTAAAVLTLDMAKHEVGADYSPRLDPSTLVNDITVTGVVSPRLKDDASIDANGVATASLATASQDDDEPLNLAGWALLQFKDPKPRVPTLTVDALAQVGKTVNCAAVMAVTIGDKVTVTNHPAQAAVTTSSYYVEGGTETYGHEKLEITWNVSPSSPDDLALIIDDPVRGVIDTNVIGL